MTEKQEVVLDKPDPSIPTDVAKIPRDLALIKMENETMMSLAAAHPRDYAVVLADLKTQLKTYKSFAQKAMFARPVGSDEGGRQKIVRGLSIRAAEAIAEAYGFNRVRCDVTPIDDDTVRVEAAFVDYQRGRVWQDAGIVSKYYKVAKKKGGHMARYPDDRFYDVIVKKEASKRIRECILRSVPPGLRSELELCIDEQLDSFLDDSMVEKIVAQFSQKGVTGGMLEKLLGKRLDSLTKEDRVTLLGIWNSIDEGQATVADVFGEAPANTTDKRTLNDLAGVDPEAEPVAAQAAE